MFTADFRLQVSVHVQYRHTEGVRNGELSGLGRREVNWCGHALEKENMRGGGRGMSNLSR